MTNPRQVRSAPGAIILPISTSKNK